MTPCEIYMGGNIKNGGVRCCYLSLRIDRVAPRVYFCAEKNKAEKINRIYALYRVARLWKWWRVGAGEVSCVLSIALVRLLTLTAAYILRKNCITL